MPTDTDEQRAKLEAWAKIQHYCLSRDKPGYYASIATHAAWHAWQAALAAQEGGWEREVVLNCVKIVEFERKDWARAGHAQTALGLAQARRELEYYAKHGTHGVLEVVQEGTGNDR